MEEARFLRSLRAVRRFAPRPVPEDVLGHVLDVARWTGSSKNSQPWEFVVVRDPETLRELATLGRYAGHLAGSPAAIALVMAEATDEFDAGRVAQNIMLAAWGFGVGSCIASLYPAENTRRAKELLSVPPDRTVDTVISLGYPADAEARSLRAAPEQVRSVVPAGRKPASELISWERYGRHAPAAGE